MPPNEFNSSPLFLPVDIVNLDSLMAVQRAIVLWSRLELLPVTADLSQGLQAPVADPLWFLGRQWQFAEFQGEDAGTPIMARLEGEAAHLSRYSPGSEGKNAVDYQDIHIPLEVVVEREAIHPVHPRLAAEAGEHFIRLLAFHGVTGVRTALQKNFALAIPDQDLPHPQADPKGKLWQTLFAGSALDGRKLAAALRTLVGSTGALTGLPTEFSFAAGRKPEVMTASVEWLHWYEGHISEPDETVKSAWIPQRQEYAMTLSAKFENETVNLAANEYTDGELDWYSFTATHAPDLGRPSQPVEVEQKSFRPVIPTPVRYPGMAADRYWEFEDGRVSFGNLETGLTDLGRLLLAEYALVCSNDWFVIPVELSVGSVFRVKTFNVRDTFGVQSPVGPSFNRDGTRWTMFSLSSQRGLPPSLQNLFFLPPTLPYRLEGDPLEEVALFRDEMANMAWGVEEIVQGASGMAMDRRMESPAPSVHQRINSADISADLIYRLMTPIPEQWLPFVPVPHTNNLPLNQFSVDLERRAILRTLPDGSKVEIHPRGILLRTDLTKKVEDEPPLRLFEEAAPREGARVKRSFQYTRWHTGKRYLWAGRQKRVGRGEGSSGLRFDVSVYTAEHTAPITNQSSLDTRRIQNLDRKG